MVCDFFASELRWRILEHSSADKIKFRDSIEAGNLKEVEDLIEKYSHQRHLLDDNATESAVKLSLTRKRFDIYELLLSHEFKLRSSEDHREIYKLLSVQEKRDVRDIHRKMAIELDLEYLATLLQNSKMSHAADKSKTEDYSKIVSQAFDHLDKIDQIRPLLKCIATEGTPKFTFDFDRESVDFMDPTQHQKMLKESTYHITGEI